MMCKPCSFYAFEMLYWTGIREGELLALTPEDFDFDKGTVRINKSYQRMNRRDVITDPKTPNSALYWRFQYGSYALWIYRPLLPAPPENCLLPS